MTLTLTQKIWCGIGSHCAIGLSTFLFGIWASNTGTLSRYGLTALAAGASVGAVAVVRDRSGELKLEISKLKAEVEHLKQKLDNEYQDKRKTTDAAVSAQNKLSKVQAKLERLQVDFEVTQRQNEEWRVVANDRGLSNSALSVVGSLIGVAWAPRLKARRSEHLSDVVCQCCGVPRSMSPFLGRCVPRWMSRSGLSVDRVVARQALLCLRFHPLFRSKSFHARCRSGAYNQNSLSDIAANG